MTDVLMPRYPVYIPSKGRAKLCQTASSLADDAVPFFLVVEEQEAEAYAARFGADRLLILPFRDQGLIAARNWIKEHAITAGADRHWQLDDNIQEFWRRWQGYRIRCHAGVALRVCEDLTDRYTNVGVSGLNYEMFAPEGAAYPPFVRNCHVYSCSLIDNSLPYRWRVRYNDDTDYCLQVLAGGRCTFLVNAFLAKKIQTMKVRGGNTADLYQGDGRLRMAQALERLWPGVVTTRRRFKRPQHVVNWRKFDTPLIPRPDLELSSLPQRDEYGLRLEAVQEVKSGRLQALVTQWQADHPRAEPDRVS